MINLLKNFFKQSEEILSVENDDLHLLCGLMIEAGNIDGKLDPKEIEKISFSLINVFHEDPKSVEDEIEKCMENLNNTKSLHYFTSRINKSFSEEKKLTLIEILWEIILEDGNVHDFESNLIRRLAGLLYISDNECGKAKQKVFERLNLNKL